MIEKKSLLHLTAHGNSKETGVLCGESEGIPATVTELTELRRIIRLFPVMCEPHTLKIYNVFLND